MSTGHKDAAGPPSGDPPKQPSVPKTRRRTRLERLPPGCGIKTYWSQSSAGVSINVLGEDVEGDNYHPHLAHLHLTILALKQVNQPSRQLVALNFSGLKPVHPLHRHCERLRPHPHPHP